MLNLSRQFASIRDEVMDAIARVCESQQLILGPVVDRFERDLAASCGVAHGVGCASGTAALRLAKAAAGVGPGDAVLTKPISFFSTVSSILRTGAHPVLADIDPLTCNLCPHAAVAACQRALALPTGPRLRAILPVHLYGQCADWDGLAERAAQHNLLLIEDAAQAIGARWRDTCAGALGHAAAFSFYPTKNLSAFGDAGLVTTPDEVLAERARMLRAHGMRRRYYHDEVGWHTRHDSVQAAVLEVKLRYLPQWTSQREALAARYDRLFTERSLAVPFEAFSDSPGSVVLPVTDPRATHVFHQYVIRVHRRDRLREHLTQNQIGSEVYYPLPLHLQPALKDLNYRPGDFPVSEAAAAEVLALPIYPELRHDEQDRVVDAIAASLRP